MVYQQNNPFKKKNKKKNIFGQKRRKERTSQQDRTRAVVTGVGVGAATFAFPKAPQQIIKGVKSIVKKIR
jgi:hypothetical protein